MSDFKQDKTKRNYDHILQTLLTAGLISRTDINKIKDFSLRFNQDILSVLKTKYAMSEDEIASNISKIYNFERIYLKDTDFLTNEELLKTLPKKIVFLEDIIPFDIDNFTIKIAIADPSKLSLVNSLSSSLNRRKVLLYITTFSEIDDGIQKLHNKYYADTGNITKEVDEARKKFLESEENEIRKAMENEEISVQSKKSFEAIDDEEVNLEETKSEGTIFLVNKIISRAINDGASDIHIEPYKTFARVRYRTEGTLVIQEDLSNIKDSYNSVVARIKISANLDISEKRKPQDGALEFKWKGRAVDLRVSVCPTAFGERVVMRILDKGSIQLDLDTLNIPDRELKLIKRSIEMPKGMGLVTGPTGSGKTTTLYSCLAKLNRPDINILTAEDPIEYSFEGIGQVKVNAKIGLTFAETLRSFLRQDPEVIMVGEIRDKETVDIAIKAALTGHFVLSTLHTNSAIETVNRLIDMGVEPYILTSAVVMILAQRLIKKSCQFCLTEDSTIDLEELLFIGFTEEEIGEIEFKKGAGCPKCNSTGYKGRQGIYEVFTFNEAIKNSIIRGDTVQQLTDIAKKNGFIDMQEHGRRLLRSGQMSIEEYKRVLLSE